MDVFGDWVVSSSSGATYSDGLNRDSLCLRKQNNSPKRRVLNQRQRTMNNEQNCGSYINIPSLQTYRSNLHFN
jgi:hypothetical protein